MWLRHSASSRARLYGTPCCCWHGARMPRLHAPRRRAAPSCCCMRINILALLRCLYGMRSRIRRIYNRGLFARIFISCRACAVTCNISAYFFIHILFAIAAALRHFRRCTLRASLARRALHGAPCAYQRSVTLLWHAIASRAALTAQRRAPCINSQRASPRL